MNQGAYGLDQKTKHPTSSPRPRLLPTSEPRLGLPSLNTPTNRELWIYIDLEHKFEARIEDWIGTMINWIGIVPLESGFTNQKIIKKWRTVLFATARFGFRQSVARRCGTGRAFFAVACSVRQGM